MADSFHVRVDGLREFRRDLRRLDPEVDRQLRTEIRDAAGKVAVRAAALAPKRTGALAASLRVSSTMRGASIYSTRPYAGVVHWGGSIAPRGVPIRFPRREFVTKAVTMQADALVNDIGDGIERAAKQLGWR